MHTNFVGGFDYLPGFSPTLVAGLINFHA